MVVTIAPRPLKYSHTVGNLALTGRGFSNPYDLTVVGGRVLYVRPRGDGFILPYNGMFCPAYVAQ